MKVTVRQSITIDRPPEAVAAVLIDADKAVLWNTDLQEFEVLTEKPGLVGSKARLHYVQDGKPYVMEDELLEVEPNRRYLSRVTGDALEAEVETRLVPENGGTKVTIRWSGTGKPLLLRLLLPLMRRSITRGVQTDLAKLKAVVEADG
jgi:uncharacterized protein YndB with AHSA1/START domain